MQQKQIGKHLLFALFFLLATILAFSQPQKQISIIISGTTYDNPNLASLKDYLKNKPGIVGFKTTFNASVATLTFTSPKDADNIWDEMPEDKRTGFTVASIDSKTIKLQGAKNSNTPAATTAKGNKNCGCEYMRLCNPDVTKNFMGQTWKGYNNDGKITYYYCENGIIRAKYELFDNFNGNSAGFATYTAFKSNEPQGASWEETVDINGAKYYYNHRILKKGVRIQAGSEKYNDAILVRRVVTAASIFYEGKPQNEMEIERQNIYYVKNVGAYPDKAVKELLDEKLETSLAENAIANRKHPHFKQIVSDSWMHNRPPNSRMNEIEFKFNEDGTMVHLINGIANEGYWRINGNLIEILYKLYLNSAKWSGELEIVPNSQEIDLKFVFVDKSILVKKSAVKAAPAKNKPNEGIRRIISTYKGLYQLDNRDKKAKINYYIEFHELGGIYFKVWNKDSLFLYNQCTTELTVKEEANALPEFFIKDCSGVPQKLDITSKPQVYIILGKQKYFYTRL
jgi:hypothetical protein